MARRLGAPGEIAAPLGLTGKPLPETDMLCRMTASSPGPASSALVMPRRLATARPQTRRLRYFLERTISECADSITPARASSSPQRLMLPAIPVLPD